MARPRRDYLANMEFCMHIMSHVVGNIEKFTPADRDYLLKLIDKYSKLFFLKVIGYCVMDDHFHLLVRTVKKENFTDEEIVERLKEHYGERKYEAEYSQKPMGYFRRRLCSVSVYVQMIKQKFSRYYNKVHKRRGAVWGERFKGTFIEDGLGLLVCMSYIDMNPVRKSLVGRPEQYRWSRYGRTWQSGTPAEGGYLTYEGTGMTDIMEYMEILEEEGKKDRSFQGKKGKIEGEFDWGLLAKRRCFNSGYAVGSAEYIGRMYCGLENHDPNFRKKGRRPNPIGVEGLFSLRKI